MKNLKKFLFSGLAVLIGTFCFAQDWGDSGDFGGRRSNRRGGGNFPQFRRDFQNGGGRFDGRDFQNFRSQSRGDEGNFMPSPEDAPQGQEPLDDETAISEMQDELTEVDKSGFVGQNRRVRDYSNAFKNKSPEEALLENLVMRNPFGGSDKQAEKSGITFNSAIQMDGEWVFGLTFKDGKTLFLKKGEQIDNLPCQISDFDEEAMLVKVKLVGREEILPLVQGVQGARRIELVAGLQPRDRPPSMEERRDIWLKYATDEERSMANNIFNAARAQGRGMNRNDFRRLREIEQNIQNRRNVQQQQMRGGGR